MTDLQSNVSVGDGVISGTLHYVEGYTGFSGLPAEQEGNYLAIHAEADGATSIGFRPIGSSESPKLLDSDGILVLRIGENATGFEFVTVVDGVTYVNVFRFVNLVREADED